MATDGDEHVNDVILRLLIEKYEPLRKIQELQVDNDRLRLELKAVQGLPVTIGQELCDREAEAESRVNKMFADLLEGISVEV